MTYTVYLVTNLVNGKVYIGYTYRSPEWRFNIHVRDCNSRRAGNRAISRAIRKYGRGSFSVAGIEVVATMEAAKQREMYYVALYRSNNNKYGYNMTEGGDGGVSEEVRKKISLANKGKKMSAEARLRMRWAKLGKPGSWLGKKRPEWSEAMKLMVGKGEANRFWLKLPIDKIVSMYQSGMSTRSIASSMGGMDHTVIMDRLTAEGIPLRTRSEWWAMRKQAGIERRKQRKRTQLLTKVPE